MLVRKRCIGFLLMLIMFISFFYTYPVSAETPELYINQIEINDAICKLDPPAFVSQGRTLVPVCFVMENSSLQGQVYWDASQRKVALDCLGHYMELFIGSRQASIDGKQLIMDVAPMVWRDRTYIPLRFLVENLGGQVNWNPGTGSINVSVGNADTDGKTTTNTDINTSKDAPRVFAYYYYSPQAELQANGYLFTDISFRWFVTDGSGNLNYEYKDDYAAKLQWARQQGIATHASVMLMNQDELHQLLSSSAHRWNLIKQLVSTAWRDNYNGIDIDFEFISSEDSAYFTQFLRDLKDSLGSEKSLSVAVPARTGQDKWAAGYDYTSIGNIADLVVVMAYDYSYVDSAPGPIAPLGWVQQVAQYMSDQMPREKVLLGLATYGYDWAGSGTGRTVTLKTLKQIQSTYKVQEHFDQKSMSPYYTYYDAGGVYHQIWMENQQSLSAKWDLCMEQDLGGISFWRIGTGFTDLYQLLAGKIGK